MTTNQTPEQAVDAAVERVRAATVEPCWWTTGAEPATEDLCAIDDAHLCDRCRKVQAVTITELDARYAAGRREGLIEGLERGCNALHWIKSRVAATEKQKRDVMEWDDDFHTAIRELKDALATPTETKPT